MNYTYQKKLSGERIGVVFGSFAPLHQGHLDAIFRAKKENDGGCIVIVCGFKGDKGEPYIPLNKRYRYVREMFYDDDLVAVYAINDDEINANRYPNGWNEWLSEFNNIWNIAVEEKSLSCKRYWYVGDEQYYTDLLARNEKPILLDRKENLISATMIRNNPIKYWDKITLPFKRVYSTNILITGTASEGKSTLVSDLGKYFNAPHSHEYARDYMHQSCVSDWELDGADYIAFLEGQYNLNKTLINSQQNHGIFFSDTDSMVTKMYAEYYAKDESCALTLEEYEKIDTLAIELDKKSRWDRIFLIAPHGIFVDDHERYMKHSAMDVREELFLILCSNIKRSGKWDILTILNGDYYNNFITIKEYVKELIERGKN